MRYFLITLIIICTFAVCSGQKLRATVSKSDSTIWLTANIRRDHRIFGYTKPDTNSRKLILFSVFTNDVKGNSFNCPYGSYYQTSNMEYMKLNFISKNGVYIKAAIIKNESTAAIIYILRKWIEFEK